MPRISLCACGVPCSLPPWRLSMKPLIVPPAPIDETIYRGSGPTCSLFPRWRPSMKPSIAPPVLFDEIIDRDSGPTGPTPLISLLHVSFELLQKLTVIAFACIFMCYCFCMLLHAVSIWNLVSAPCSETGPNLGT